MEHGQESGAISKGIEFPGLSKTVRDLGAMPGEHALLSEAPEGFAVRLAITTGSASCRSGGFKTMPDTFSPHLGRPTTPPGS